MLSFGAEFRSVPNPEKVRFGSGRGEFIVHIADIATTSSTCSCSTHSNYSSYRLLVALQYWKYL